MRPRLLRRQRALTLTELLVASLISVIFVSSVTMAFMGILRASDDAEAIVRANIRARAALDQMGRELQAITPLSGNPFPMEVIDATLSYGDGVDNDGDGFVDEEPYNGRDDDGDWVGSRDDRHAFLGTSLERPEFTNRPDAGDLRVDEDVRFSADEVRFQGLDTSGNLERVRYFIGSFEGEANVLIREGTRILGGNTVVERTPVIYDVLSLDVLAWEVNARNGVPDPSEPRGYWRSNWSSAFVSNGVRPIGSPAGTPALPFPASFRIRVTVYAGTQPLSTIRDFPLQTGSLRTEWIETVVTVDSTLSDPRYEFVRQN